jgi:hypothetical protein
MQRPLSSVDVVIAFAELGTGALRELCGGQDDDRGLTNFNRFEEFDGHFGSQIDHQRIVDGQNSTVKLVVQLVLDPSSS